ncbi:MAG: hypothetical protein LBP89_06455 [Helicobacteraceae bacterium]|jgi:DNA polymerase-3 subunit delta'|nr:hypothetical protein [Helicobacteraceae bacterium]
MGALWVCADKEAGLKRILAQIGDAPKIVFWTCADKEAGLKRLDDLIGKTPRTIVEAKNEEFPIDAARALIAQAYVASEREKFLIAAADGYGREAQNALLKALEEPPRNITIYLLGTKKSAFLATVRSRLPLWTIPAPKTPAENLIDFARFDLKTVYEFVKTYSYLPRDRAKRLIEEALDYFLTLKSIKTPLKGRVLAAIERAFRLTALNSSAANAILPVLLLLLECKNSAKTAV